MAAIALVTVVTVAGCSTRAKSSSPQKVGTSGGTSSTTSTPSTTDSLPDLHVEALALVDLPDGWSLNPPSVAGSDEPSCLKTFKNPTGALTKLNESFKGATNGVPTFNESLAYFASTRVANAALAHLSTVLTGCRHIATKVNDIELQGGVVALSFPAVADESHAFQLRLTGTAKGQTVTVAFDIIIARKGTTVMLSALGDIGNPDTDLLTSLTDKAITKLATRVA